MEANAKARREDGGPAFPVSEEAARGKVAAVYGGMTLRDYFAAAALQGLLATPVKISLGAKPVQDSADYSEMAYRYADAMIEARGL